jgi:DNA-binding FadR family transcriptional regulator
MTRTQSSDSTGQDDSLGAVAAVEQRLTDLLSHSEIRPGDRLPTERSLVAELQVPRSAVRRAFARLEAKGLVVRVIGSGTYVAETTAGLTRPSSLAERADYSPREIMEARILIEPRFSSLIVMHANKADLEAIRETMLAAERSTDFVTFEHWDGQFHQMLAEATHNSLIIDLFRIITRSRDTAEWGELKKGSITAERRELYCQEHARIFDALQARNAKLSAKAIEAHLTTVRQNLFGL